jgi:hypothetical protein
MMKGKYESFDLKKLQLLTSFAKADKELRAWD